MIPLSIDNRGFVYVNPTVNSNAPFVAAIGTAIEIPGYPLPTCDPQ